jgi:hypothetical protein
MEATQGHTLTLPRFENTNGTVRAAGGSVEIDYIKGVHIGTLESTDGGVISFRNVDNAGHTFTATPTTGDLRLTEWVRGGTMATTGGAKFFAEGCTLTDTTLAGSFEVRTTAFGSGVRATST